MQPQNHEKKLVVCFNSFSKDLGQRIPHYARTTAQRFLSQHPRKVKGGFSGRYIY